jgi:hypothetical protein
LVKEKAISISGDGFLAGISVQVKNKSLTRFVGFVDNCQRLFTLTISEEVLLFKASFSYRVMQMF